MTEPLTLGAILKDWLSKDHKQEMFAIAVGLLLDVVLCKLEGQDYLKPGAFFVIQAVILIFSILLIEYWWFKHQNDKKVKQLNIDSDVNELENIKQNFDLLTPPELEKLSAFIVENTSALSFSIRDGIVAGLCDKKFIYRSTTIATGSLSFTFEFNINPWARNYLLKHPEIIIKPKTKYGQYNNG